MKLTRAVCLALTLITTLLSGFASAEEKPRYLIVHSDDAGMSHSVNVATQEGLATGIVSSASIMVPCPWFKEFAEFAKGHPEYDYGIHLTLNSEWDVYRWGPVASRDQVPSLVDKEGYLWDGVKDVFEHAVASEVRIELKAQIDKALAFGVPLSHLDTHMGAVVSRPDLVEVYVGLGLEYNLPVLFFKKMPDALRKEYPALADRHAEAVSKLTQKKLPLLDELLQFYGGENLEARRKLYFDEMSKVGPGVTQLIIHCGHDDTELRAISNSSARRNQDREIFSDPATKKWIESQGIKIITWREFRKLTFPEAAKP